MTDVPTDQIFKTEPYQHQVDALLASRDKRVYALLMEMGTGKTKVAIDTASYLYGKGEINGLLVIAPKTICRNWAQKEIPTHLPDHINRRTVLWGPQSAKLAGELGELLVVEPLKLHILVVNVEALASERAFVVVSKFLRGHQAMIVIDESTTVKNPRAARTKYVTKLGLQARYKRIMTGTPVTQSPLDVFAQFEFLEHGCLGSSSFYGFRNQYAVLQKRYVNGRSFDQVVGYQRLEELQKAIGHLSYRVLKKDCLDLPDKVYEVRNIELTPTQKQYYEQMRDEALAAVGDGMVAAPLVLTQLLRLRQALCNLAPAPDNGAVPIDPKSDPRRSEVMDLLAEAGDQKVIIWANFRPSLNLLAEAIKAEYGPESCGLIHGDIPQDKRQEYVTKFQDPADKLRFMVAQPRTGGYGLTLTAATLVIYHDNDWSLEVRQQSEDRAHRIGQTQKVTYVDLVAPGTVDEKIRQALLDKRDLASRVTGDTLRELLTDS